MMDQTIFLFITILLFIIFANGLVGYDYGNYGFNIISLSPLDTYENCNLKDYEGCLRPTTTTLLRQNTGDPMQGENFVDRAKHYCGMDSHVSIVYLQEMTTSNCRRIHETGTIDVGDRESYISRV